ncbi:dCTP deaminase domain-containing protein [Runella limosa]|uniref:dCTP deaminase domain-containing protein n=1 Tax=Runella limosa TaxID=370978 RepID=UPI0012F78FEB|nr:deoxycytidine triphosphate deaminase [Runella limosa]
MNAYESIFLVQIMLNLLLNILFMAFLSKKELAQLLPSCIDKFESERIAEAAYELCLGNEVYLTDSTSGKKELLDEKNSQVVIKSGQFALLLTQENVKIPLDKIAFISIKFSQKIKGLVNISGFHVDPGFDGKIIFSVYNAGPTTIILDKGKPYFMIWFSELSSQANPYAGKHQKQKTISAEQISQLNGTLASPNSLLKQIQDLEKKVDIKVEELKGKKDYNKWVLQAIIAVLLGLFVKQWMDKNLAR